MTEEHSSPSSPGTASGSAPGDSPADNDSLQAWIERAKRAHELVEAVDLDKVAQHDAEEVGKVTSVGQALDNLSAGGEIEHVEGVDEVAADLDADDQRRADLLAHLTAAGWTERVGRVLFVDGDTTALKPVELIPHRKGLPEFDICIAPEQAVGLGNFALLISAQGVFSATVNEPSSKHHWHITRSRPYDSIEELFKIIVQFSQSGDEKGR
ncbi:MAG: hypothetical protein AAF993_00750 [Pseudomonadota bacterium]